MTVSWIYDWWHDIAKRKGSVSQIVLLMFAGIKKLYWPSCSKQMTEDWFIYHITWLYCSSGGRPNRPDQRHLSWRPVSLPEVWNRPENRYHGTMKMFSATGCRSRCVHRKQDVSSGMLKPTWTPFSRNKASEEKASTSPSDSWLVGPFDIMIKCISLERRQIALTPSCLNWGGLFLACCFFKDQKCQYWINMTYSYQYFRG